MTPNNNIPLTVVLALAILVTNCQEVVSPPATSFDTNSPGIPPDLENRAPQLYKIGDRYVGLGETLIIEPRASDADGDKLSYFVQPLPKGSVFQKSPPRFKWTPTELQTTSATFVVSDGEDTDRETVQIRVVTEIQNHTPIIQPIGDQALEVGQSYTLQLQASDSDGDPITFTVNDLPIGASLDEDSGLFGWMAPPALEGSSPTLTFTVSDGQASATIDVRFFVLAPGQNKPPAFDPISPQVATVGELYKLTISATDPDNDSLTYGFQGTPPSGATFDPTTARFTWSPLESQAGETWELSFSVSDGIYNIFSVVDVEVVTPSVSSGTCEDDAGEPNNDPEFATPINVGAYDNLWLCDSDVSPVDEDWYTLSLSAGQTLAVSVEFTHQLGDIDIALYKATDLSTEIALADSATDNEVLSYVTPQLGVYLLRIFGIGQLSFESPYVLNISTSGLNCTDDGYEPNNTPNEASLLTSGVLVNDAMYCPADIDWWKVTVSCGAQLAAQITANDSEGKLELTAYREGLFETAVGTTDTGASNASLFYTAPKDESIYLKVVGDPPESTLNEYTLLAQQNGSASCTDDTLEPNNSKSIATALTSPSDKISEVRLCCDEDWFFTPVTVGSALLATVSYPAGANVNASIYALDGTEPLAIAQPDAQGLLLELNPAPFSGNFYIKVEGDPGTVYEIEMIVAESEGCATSKGCGEDKVCWKATGICLDDYCADESDCPFEQEMPCEANQCLDGCSYDAECKLGWSCKGFDYGRYCGANGTGTTGETCTTFLDCSGPSACGFPQAGGYCTNYGCSGNQMCSGSASCVQYAGTTLCANHCTSNSDCRTEDGHTCQPKKLINNLDVNVCLPAI